MSAPFGPSKFGMNLSRALRRARRRAMRLGGQNRGGPIRAADHLYQLEALEPRILMSADIALASLQGYTAGTPAELRLASAGSTITARLYVGDLQQGGDIDLTSAASDNVLDILGSDGTDAVTLVFEDGFDAAGVTLSFDGGADVDTVTIRREGALVLGGLTVASEAITLARADGAAGVFTVTGAVDLGAATDVMGGSAQVVLTDSLAVDGAARITAMAERDFTEAELGYSNYNFGTSRATVTFGTGGGIRASDVQIAAMVTGTVSIGGLEGIPGDIGAAISALKLVLIDAVDIAAVDLGVAEISGGLDATGGVSVAATVDTIYDLAGMLVTQDIVASATITGGATTIDAGEAGVDIAAATALTVSSVGPYKGALDATPTFPMAMAAFAFNTVDVTAGVTLTGAVITSDGDISVTATDETTVLAHLAGNATSFPQEFGGGDNPQPSGLPDFAISGMIAANEVLADVTVDLTDVSLTGTGNLTVAATNGIAVTANVEGGVKSGSTALGASVAFNSMGYETGNLWADALNVLLGTTIGQVADPLKTRVTLTDVTADMGGDVEVSATAKPTVEATVVSSASADEESLGMGLVLSGNRIRSDVVVTIDGDSADPSVQLLAGGGLAVTASDEATITSAATVEATSAGGPAAGGLAARNEVDSTVTLSVTTAILRATTGDLSVEASTTATIEATVAGNQPEPEEEVAEETPPADDTDPAPEEEEEAGASFALTGIIANNVLRGGVALAVTSSRLSADEGAITVAAINAGTITAENKGAATGEGTAVGVSLAFNSIGWQAQNILFSSLDAILGTSIGNEDPALATVTLTDSTLTAGGDLAVSAENTQTITATLAAAAASGAAAAAGILLSSNMVSARTRVTQSNTTLTSGGNLALLATEAATVEATVELAVAGATVAAGGLAARNDLRSDVDLTVSASTLAADGDMDIAARAAGTITATLSGEFKMAPKEEEEGAEAAPADDAAAGEEDGGLAIGGHIANNLILVDVAATITGSDLTAGGNLTALARSSGDITAENKATVSSTGTTVGLTLAFNSVGWQAQNILFGAIDALLGTSIGNEQPAQAVLTVTDSRLNAGGDMAMDAESAQAIVATLAGEATSTGGVGAGIVIASNMVSSRSKVVVKATYDHASTEAGAIGLVTGDRVLVAPSHTGGGEAGRIYEYVGAAGPVTLSAADYSDSTLWAMVTADYDLASHPAPLSAVNPYEIVNSGSGLYQYLGTEAELHLPDVDFDTADWRPYAQVYGQADHSWTDSQTSVATGALVDVDGALYEYLGAGGNYDLANVDYAGAEWRLFSADGLTVAYDTATLSVGDSLTPEPGDILKDGDVYYRFSGASGQVYTYSGTMGASDTWAVAYDPSRTADFVAEPTLVTVAPHELVEYGGRLYEYLGDGSMALNLAAIDYDTDAAWSLYGSKAADHTVALLPKTVVASGTRVLVDPLHDAGGIAGRIYRYIGPDAEIDLTAVDFGADANWTLLPQPNGLMAGGSVAVRANDSATITAETELSAEGTTAVGGLVVRNDVRGGVDASLTDMSVVSGGDFVLSAIGTATIEATATGSVKIAEAEEEEGATPAEGEEESGGIAFGGLIANNSVLGGASATVTRGEIVSGGGLDVLADTLTGITATNAMAAEAAAGTAVGVTLAFNSVGWSSTDIFSLGASALLGTSIGTEAAVATVAKITDTRFSADGALRVLAGGTDPEAERLGAQVTAGIDSSTAGGAGSAGVGLVLATNRVLTTTTAGIVTTIADPGYFTLGSAEVAAKDAAAIEATTAMTAGSGGGAAVGIVVVLNDARSTVDATIDGLSLLVQDGLSVSAEAATYFRRCCRVRPSVGLRDVRAIRIAGQACGPFTARRKGRRSRDTLRPSCRVGRQRHRGLRGISAREAAFGRRSRADCRPERALCRQRAHGRLFRIRRSRSDGWRAGRAGCAGGVDGEIRPASVHRLWPHGSCRIRRLQLRSCQASCRGGRRLSCEPRCAKRTTRGAGVLWRNAPRGRDRTP